MKLRVVPHESSHFEAYVSWCQQRNIPPMPVFLRSDAFVWVLGQKGLVLGVGLFESGGFLMAEYLVTNPKAGTLERYRATLLAAEQMVAMATLRSKFLLVHTSSRGLMRVLERKGFVVERLATLLRPPFVQASYRDKAAPEQVPTPKPHPDLVRPPKAKRRVGPRRRKPA